MYVNGWRQADQGSGEEPVEGDDGDDGCRVMRGYQAQRENAGQEGGRYDCVQWSDVVCDVVWDETAECAGCVEDCQEVECEAWVHDAGFDTI